MLKSILNINRFKQKIKTSGYVAKDGKAHCISPLLYETGFIPFEVSTDDGLTFPYSGTWLSGYLLKSTTMAVTLKRGACVLITLALCIVYELFKPASAFGDPHFFTFDGLNFTFKGQGEYTLVESDLTALRVQGRAQQAHFPNGTGAQVTGLSAVAMQENNSDVIEVRYSENLNLEVLLNQRVISFSEQSWMDLKGLFLHSTVDQNITVMFSSGSGVEIRGSGGFLTLTVLLPEKFMNHTQGLFGVMNGNTEDDYTFKNKTTMSVHASPQQLFEFGANLISCGWLDHPTNGRKNGTNYLLGSTISFICNQGYELTGSKERICQVTGAWSGDTPSCVPRTDIKQVILLGCVLGIVGLAVLARLTFLCRKERHKGNQKLDSEVPVVSEHDTVEFQRSF
ncbi:sushi domain-containing protein 2 [Grus japonensis]|uniref:Sushi domain-containing protein 2 n=1 Tax=Grus japonensis TaxID=30415 RepID=A0ABC9XHG1_GRUJA